jgi:hypothetical protein
MKVESARWMPLATPQLQREIVWRAFCDIGICEDPPGSNRSVDIDEYNRLAGAPVGSYWCASWAAAMYRDAGAQTPGKGKDPVVEEWLKWARANGTFIDRSQSPEPGYLALYDYAKDPKQRTDHCGIVVRVTPGIFVIEGNTSGAPYSRNGELVDFKPAIMSGVVGWVRPTPRA